MIKNKVRCGNVRRARLRQGMVRKTILILIVSLAIVTCYGAETNKVEKILNTVKDIRYEHRNYTVKDISDIENVAQKPSETLSKKSGNCCDSAILAKELAEKEGLKADLKFENHGKHVVVIVTEGVKKTKISNGRKRL